MHNRSFLIGIAFGVALAVLAFFAFVNGRYMVPVEKAEEVADAPGGERIKVPIVAGLSSWTIDQMTEIGGAEYAAASEKLGFDLEMAVGRISSELPYDNYMLPRKMYFDSFAGCERLIAIEVCAPVAGYMILGTLYGRAHRLTFSWSEPVIQPGISREDPAMAEGPLPEEWDMESETAKDYNFVDPKKKDD